MSKKIEKALDILKCQAESWEETISPIYWVTEDGASTDGDYCEDCVDYAIRAAKNSYKKYRKSIYKKYKILRDEGLWNGKSVREQYTDEEIKKSAIDGLKQELKELGKISEFCCEGSNCGYESSHFRSCDICGRELDICILPNCENVRDVIDDIDSSIDDQTAYRASQLMSSLWNDKKHKEVDKLIKKLAKKIVKLKSADVKRR